MSEAGVRPSGFLPGALIIGVAFSGFFDGVLLHQVLQWHHLLSLAPGEAFRDPRIQIAGDGLFHVLMYGLALLGLARLVKEMRLRPSRGAFWRGFAIGFGAWNVLDAVVFHWILRWHRIRLDAEAPLAWDLGWLVAFGLVPLVLGLLVGPPRARPKTFGPVSMMLVTAALLGAGVWASRPSPSGTIIVLFAPNRTPAQTMAAIAQVEGRLIAFDASGQVAAIKLDSAREAWRLYGAGALLVSSASPAGCAAWTARPGA